MTEGIRGSNPGVSQLPTTAPLTERGDNARLETKGQQRNNDFTSYLNDQSISTEKRAVKSQQFDPADEINSASVYSGSSGKSAI